VYVEPQNLGPVQLQPLSKRATKRSIVGVALSAKVSAQGLVAEMRSGPSGLVVHSRQFGRRYVVGLNHGFSQPPKFHADGIMSASVAAVVMQPSPRITRGRNRISSRCDRRRLFQ